MNAHLTGSSRAIPVVLVLDEDYRKIGWWGPRPDQLQRWTLGEARAWSKEDRYRETRRWYEGDHGHSAMHELLGVLESASCAMCTGT